MFAELISSGRNDAIEGVFGDCKENGMLPRVGDCKDLGIQPRVGICDDGFYP